MGSWIIHTHKSIWALHIASTSFGTKNDGNTTLLPTNTRHRHHPQSISVLYIV